MVLKTCYSLSRGRFHEHHVYLEDFGYVQAVLRSFSFRSFPIAIVHKTFSPTCSLSICASTPRYVLLCFCPLLSSLSSPSSFSNSPISLIIRLFNPPFGLSSHFYLFVILYLLPFSSIHKLLPKPVMLAFPKLYLLQTLVSFLLSCLRRLGVHYDLYGKWLFAV